MKVLLVHNYYQQPGGEDQVFLAEKESLESRGHTVSLFTVHNDQIKDMNALSVAAATLWGKGTVGELAKAVDHHKPDIVHFHNTFPLISPAAYAEVKKHSIPVVQTIHNYRLICGNALLYRNHAICAECTHKAIPYPLVVHGCYHNSRFQSLGVAAMLSYHRMLKTWQRQVDAYIMLSEFARAQLAPLKIPAEKMFVKPNFLHPDPGYRGGKGAYALFVGRLSQEKGILSLLDSWELITDVPLIIIGDGPLRQVVEKRAAALRHQLIHFMGAQPHDVVIRMIQASSFLVLPSEWFEGFPMVILEAFACGKPIISTGQGAMASEIIEGRTGIFFSPGNHGELASKVTWAWNNPDTIEQMGQWARLEYETRFTESKNYERTMQIYRFVCDTQQDTGQVI